MSNTKASRLPWLRDDESEWIVDRIRGQRCCVIRGCVNGRLSTQIMCRVHWLLVPGPLRDEIWRTYRRKQRPSWRVAVREAIRAVEPQP